MKLFNFKKKQPTPTNSLGQPLDKLINGELPFGWVKHYEHYYKPRNDQMVQFAKATQPAKSNDERIDTLRHLIAYFYMYQEECFSKGECFKKWFEDYWMHCKNSTCEDFIYITPYEEELKILEGRKKVCL